MRNASGSLRIAFALAATLPWIPAQAALTYPGCADLKPSDFAVIPLVNYGTDKTVQEPIKMALDADASGNTDIYFVQRLGKVRKYSTAKKAMITIGDFAFTAAQVPDTRNSKGLNGIALDPDFKNTHWMYFYIGLDNDWRVSRFKLNGEVLDLASERVLFRFDGGGKATTHVAGALKFDAEGNLWISNSENEANDPSANTDSYLGKILRIKPRRFSDAVPAPAPGNGSTYDIPAGNLYPAGTDKALPEIYIMGTRNPYTITLDPVRRAIAWGDIGPDGYGVTEEFNFATKPGNFGYPGWAGNQKAIQTGYGTPAAPTYPGTAGIKNLPPAIAPIIAYGQACAVTGPVYYYDANLASPIKFPPHLNGAWLIGEFNQSWIEAVELDAPGSKVLSRLRILEPDAGGQLNKPLDIQMGPDGAMYIMNYSGFRTWNAKTGLLRVEYKGDCHPVSLAGKSGPGERARLEGAGLRLGQTGIHRIRFVDASGRIAARISARGPGTARLATGQVSGLRIMLIEYPDGTSGRILLPGLAP